MRNPRLTARVAVTLTLVALLVLFGVDTVAADSSRNQPMAIYDTVGGGDGE